MRAPLLISLLAATLCGCASQVAPNLSTPRFVRFGPGGPDAGFAALRNEFAARNPGYDVTFRRDLIDLRAEDSTLVVFVQRGESPAEVERNTGERLASGSSIGDVILLRANEQLRFTNATDVLVFVVPDPPSEDVPTFVRPDWDPRITDTPGGCATETGAYRRIALTWKRDNGPYTYHAINAHRVRITDSFTHYHPVEGGFDEFYLVQLAQTDARIITSEHTREIIAPDTVTPERAAELLTETKLAPGDLVYLPRGVVHRGLGGVLAHVITVPGFVPGSEIGVDHHLAAINRRLELDGDRALPHHAAGAQRAIVK